MDQTVWNTINGRVFEMSNSDGVIVSRLSAHADFLLVLISPFYLIWSDPRMLLLLQVVVVALGAFFVYAISNRVLKNKTFSLVAAFAFLINPAVERANLYDFHAVTLATTFLLATFYFYLKKSYKCFLLFAILSALCKEQVWAIIAIFGIFLFFQQKKRVFGAIVFFVSSVIFYLIIWYLIPYFLGSQHFAVEYYSSYGDSPTKVVLGLITSPNKVFGILLAPDRLSYLVKLFLPNGFLSILSPLYIIFAVPDLIINLFSSKSLFRELYYHYTAIISPFIFISTIYSVSWLKTKLKKININIFSFYILFFALLSAYLYGPLPGARGQDVEMYTKIVPNKTFINSYLASIPKKYSVAADNNIASHLSERRQVYILPSTSFDRADIVIFFNANSEEKPLLKKTLENPNYRLIMQRGEFLVFKKQAVLVAR
jgi:uncharacterized membrane protein